MLFPDNGDGLGYIGARLGDYARVLTEQLGLGRHPALGVSSSCSPSSGWSSGASAAPGLDGPLAALTVLIAARRQHALPDGRAVLLPDPAVGALLRRAGDHRAAMLRSPWAAVRSLAASTRGAAARTWSPSTPSRCPATSARARLQRRRPPADRADRPDVTPIFDAVSSTPPPDDVIVFFRARTMTLYTDRRTIQTTDIDRVLAPRRLLRPAAQLGLLPAADSPSRRPSRASRGLVGRQLDPLAGASTRRRSPRRRAS